MAKSKPKRIKGLQHKTIDVKVDVVHDRKERMLCVNYPDGVSTGWYPYEWWQYRRPHLWCKLVDAFEIKE